MNVSLMSFIEVYFSVVLQYTYLLASQLEAQRHHFEEKIERVEKEALVRVGMPSIVDVIGMPSIVGVIGMPSIVDVIEIYACVKDEKHVLLINRPKSKNLEQSMKICILYGFPCEMDFSRLFSESHPRRRMGFGDEW